MKLSGLKDEDGKAYDLIIESDSLHSSWQIESVDSKTESEPEFRVGDWVAFDDYRKLFRCVRIDGQYLKDDRSEMYHIDYCSHATPEEIESHLRKIFKERGFTQGAKFKPIDSPDGHIRTIGDSDDFFYDAEEDEFHGSTPESEWIVGCANPIIYAKGKFAEIIPEKKHLPKTKDETKEILLNFYEFWDNSHGYKIDIIDNFLKDYED